MNTVTLPHGKTFEVNDQETLLDAALRAGVAFEHSCRTGRCGTCKGRAEEGETAVVRGDETGLSAQEQSQGWVLTCVRTAVTPVRLDIRDLGSLRLPTTRTLPSKIQSLERLAPDVLRVVLRLPPTQPWDILPGQYIDILGPDGLRRSYSVANRPTGDKLIELHIRAVAGGAMSRYWFEQARLNDLLRLHGPLGTFCLRDDLAGQDLVFLATGTGIAPVKAMLEQLAQLPADAQPRHVAVYWGGRHPHDLYWDPALALPGVDFTPVLSRADSGWQGARGHVQDVFLSRDKKLDATSVYACGSSTMIDTARAALVAAGLAPARFHADAFVCSS